MIVNNYRSKELSWLSFNERLLQEAERNEVPIIERIKFLGIYSNNLDEFFRVRVAILKRFAQLDRKTLLDGGYPQDILAEIHRIVLNQNKRFSKIYKKLIHELSQSDIHLINETELSESQKEFVSEYFVNKVRSTLMPIIITKGRELPDLKDDAIYFAVELKNKAEDRVDYAIMEIPSVLNRFVKLPNVDKQKYIILLDDVIRFELQDIFYMFEIDEVNAYTMKLTRDAELDITDDVSQNYVEKVVKSLERRKDAPPVRFVVDEKIPEDFLKLLLRKLNFSKDDAVIKGGRYHNFKDFMKFPNVGNSSFAYPALKSIPHKDIVRGKTFISILKEKDILLHFPYHSFHQFIEFLQEVSIDISVKEIKLTIYRVAKNSSVINALINAARNGKKVTAIFELQARFDEKANIFWANRMKEEGVKVVYGVPGLKVHCKLCLVVRKEKRQIVNYACIGTGNFNEDSAKVFSDHLLFTSHSGLTKDVANIFEFFDKNYKNIRYNHLLVSPFSLRNKLSQMLQNEINNAKAGKKAYAYIKVNNLVDMVMIRKIYRAKKAGVDIRLNVRGMFSLVTKFDKYSEEIPAIGLIDRFLEHSRVFIFCNNNAPKVYLSSADIMSRNLDRRIEVACPVYDNKLKEEITEMFNIQWKDNISARVLNNKLDNPIRSTKSKRTIRSQIEFYKYLLKRSQSRKR